MLGRPNPGMLGGASPKTHWLSDSPKQQHQESQSSISEAR